MRKYLKKPRILAYYYYITMTPEAKILTVLKNINNAIIIAPSKGPVFVDIKKLEKSIPRIEQEQIFQKLAKDDKLFKIQKKPDYEKSFQYRIQITDPDKFHEALNNASIKHFGSLEMLLGDNLFSVIDVAADIALALQMTIANSVKIHLCPSVIRFPNLMPANAVNFRDRYCDFRWSALTYLKSHGQIQDFELDDTLGLHRWGYKVIVLVDRIKFDEFYEKLIKTYQKRVKFPTKEEKEKAAATIPQPPVQRVEIIGGQLDINPKFSDTEKKIITPKIDLQSSEIKYDDDKSLIIIGNKNVSLPPYKHEHYFCQVMFEYKAKEPISWDIIYDRMNGHTTVSGGKKPEPVRENWQKVNDTMKRVNNRIKEVCGTDDMLFSWTEKTVVRNY